MGILSNPFDKGVENAPQKSAHTVWRHTYNTSVRRNPANNGFTVMHAEKHMFGIVPTPKYSKKNSGSSYGLKKVIRSDNSLKFPAIASLSSSS